MRKLLKKQGMAPDTWVTDKCPAYGAALRELNLNRAAHVQRKRANNRAESSHVPVRRRERSNKASSRPVQLNAFSPCMRPPTTPSPFPVTSFQPARIGSSGQRRSRRGALRPAWPHEKVANVGLALPCADNAENKVRLPGRAVATARGGLVTTWVAGRIVGRARGLMEGDDSAKSRRRADHPTKGCPTARLPRLSVAIQRREPGGSDGCLREDSSGCGFRCSVCLKGQSTFYS